MLQPEIAAFSMSGSSFLMAVNALMLRRLRLPPAELIDTDGEAKASSHRFGICFDEGGYDQGRPIDCRLT